MNLRTSNHKSYFNLNDCQQDIVKGQMILILAIMQFNIVYVCISNFLYIYPHTKVTEN